MNTHVRKNDPVALILFMLPLFLLVGCLQEQASTVASRYGDDPIVNGKISYEAYCASCHGAQARGDGPVAEALSILPADLTRLQTNNEGIYPTERVYTYIDGREDVRAHGTREMPVWGNVWSEQDGHPVRAEEIEMRINELVEYLRTLQEGASMAGQ